jgi:hypothetical protein
LPEKSDLVCAELVAMARPNTTHPERILYFISFFSSKDWYFPWLAEIYAHSTAKSTISIAPSPLSGISERRRSFVLWLQFPRTR